MFHILNSTIKYNLKQWSMIFCIFIPEYQEDSILKKRLYREMDFPVFVSNSNVEHYRPRPGAIIYKFSERGINCFSAASRNFE